MGQVAFLLPHPDDEFAVALPIRDLRRLGTQVQVVFLTDGGFGGQDRDRRENESRAALRELGVGDAQVHFLGRRIGLPDGALHLHLDRALEALVAWMHESGPSDEFHVPAWEGGHQDHDAAHLLGLALAPHQPTARLRQFPLYRPVGGRWPLFRVMAPLAANGPVVARPTTLRERIGHLSLCMHYRSQWRSWLGLLPLLALHHLVDGRFVNQPVTGDRILLAPAGGAPLYQRRGFLDWRDFAAATRAFRERLHASAPRPDHP